MPEAMVMVMVMMRPTGPRLDHWTLPQGHVQAKEKGTEERKKESLFFHLYINKAPWMEQYRATTSWTKINSNQKQKQTYRSNREESSSEYAATSSTSRNTSALVGDLILDMHHELSQRLPHEGLRCDRQLRYISK